MKMPMYAAVVIAWWVVSPVVAEERPHVLVVVGAAGTPEYEKQFRAWAERWQAAAKQGEAESTTIGLTGEDPSSEPSDDRERLRAHLEEQAGNGQQPLWIVLIGHGTFDGKRAKFNLRGPDVTPADLNEWLAGRKGLVAIIHCASCSGPFLSELSGDNRVIITATRSGHELNFARLGDYLSAAIADGKADLDKDEQTSLLEAYLVAAARVREFYMSEARLVTEHALLDDNGDRMGTPADWFRGLRPTKAAKAGAELDGGLASRLVLVASPVEQELSAEIRMERDNLERQLAALRQRKQELAEDEYLAQLEPLLVKIARLYQANVD
jgi:hypothetical protein